MITLPKSILWFKNSKCNAKETFAELMSMAALVWGICFLQNGKHSKTRFHWGQLPSQKFPKTLLQVGLIPQSNHSGLWRRRLRLVLGWWIFHKNLQEPSWMGKGTHESFFTFISISTSTHRKVFHVHWAFKRGNKVEVHGSQDRELYERHKSNTL